MRLAIAASSYVAIPTLEAIVRSEHQISQVITQPDSHSGRGRELAPTDVALWAVARGLPVIKAQSDLDVRQAISDSELLVAIGFGRILSEETISAPRFGSINLHFSKLPSYRGAAPAQRSLLAGDSSTGVSVFALDKGLDTGPVYIQMDCEIDPYWTGQQLLEQLSVLGASAVMKTIKAIEDGVAPYQQTEEGVSIAPKISKDELVINWNDSAKKISLQVRAFSPSVTTIFRANNFKVALAFPCDISMDLSIGEVAVVDKRVLVGTAEGNLELIEVIPAGKNVMSAFSWANGARLLGGEHFG